MFIFLLVLIVLWKVYSNLKLGVPPTSHTYLKGTTDFAVFLLYLLYDQLHGTGNNQQSKMSMLIKVAKPYWFSM